METEYATGAFPSPIDVRTFIFRGDKAKAGDTYLVGESWANTEYIEDQHRVGICTAISMTMRARKHFNVDFSDDFQYLLQKKFIDNNWREGSSAFSACKVGHKFGFLPQKEWTHTTMEDRKLSYKKYIEKLKAIPDDEIERLIALASAYKIDSYAKIANNVESLGAALAENGPVIARFVVGREWYRAPIEPLRRSLEPISGHLVNITKRHGSSYRIANSWGTDWADGGTAYSFFGTNPPTEMWQIWFGEVPDEIEKQKAELLSLKGQLLTLLQQLVALLNLKYS